MRNVAGAVV